jgi:5-methylthioadenosine/S-adenosylhomocysteine deaminase
VVEKKKVALVIQAGTILPVDEHDSVLSDHALVVDGGRIVDLLPSKEAQAKYQTDELVDLPGHALIPGLINAHAHSPMVLLRGLGDDKPLFEWLSKHIWPAEADLVTSDFVADGTQLAMCEMIRSGTTCFAEHYFHPDVTASVAAKMGMRAQVGLWVGDVKTPWAGTADECMQLGRAAHEQFGQQQPNNTLVSFAIAPHSPYMVDDRAFNEIKAWRDSADLRVHIHLHETAQEIEDSLRDYGVRPIERLARLGLLDERMQAVHMTQMNDHDMALLRDHKVSLVTCPASNLKLASGFAPIHDALSFDVNVAIGTDGAASNNGLDMLADMRMAALLAKGVSRDATALPAQQALRMATLNGARALGIEDETGSLAVGKSADVVAINLEHYALQPVHHPYLSIVYAHASEHVSDVWIAGSAKLRQGEWVDIDLKGLYSKCHMWINKTKPYAE